MPVQGCRTGGKPGFKFGAEGTCHTYNPHSQASKNRARIRALESGVFEGDEEALSEIDGQSQVDGQGPVDGGE